MPILIQCFFAFCGGIFGTLIGGTAAFIFSGLLVLLGSVIIITTGQTFFVDTVAMGPMFAPHIAFVGSVAAASFTSTPKDTMSARLKEENIMSLLIGGLFGTIGFLIFKIINTIHPDLDASALSVLVCAILTRFISRKPIWCKNPPQKSNLTFIGIWSFAIAILTAQIVKITGIANIGWAISAVSLVFLYIDRDNFPVTHHITMIAGMVVLTTNSILIAGIIGALISVLGEIVDSQLNSEVTSAFDMPATLIGLMSVLLVVLV